MAAYLQDESLEIREEAASVLSKLVLNTDMPLNPDVCYRLITEVVLESEKPLRKFEQDENSNGDLLYDACSTNAYAESHLFGDFAEVRKMVNELLTA
ncbi:hypothetical protein OESDEN_25638 [Oesophagostomum dentatum]|uniref:Uncharacterized protein n=1 Tax=Oesophagostomum dentatum TaxID=61180 RepID=A0A0B1RSX1_OESDE|nr:hypothetical protein OESDEN_25638 [Oesophagostomum dentatum]